MSKPRSKPSRHALARLRRYFERNGYARSAPDRRARPLSHRGYEIRFAAHDRREVETIVGLLRRVGIEPGAPFAKGAMFRVPVYGSAQVVWLLEAMATT